MQSSEFSQRYPCRQLVRPSRVLRMPGLSFGLRRAVAAAIVGLLAASCTASSSAPSASGHAAGTGIHKIKHVVIIMQENRSFDSFFGTYPGADGIPAKNGQFTVCVPDPRTTVCLPGSTPDVMGYHDAREIPNYWTYAHDFVLNDHMFEPVDSWSLPSHLYLVSEWSARCTSTNPDSCVNDPAQAGGRLKLRNLPSAFLDCLRAHGVTALRRANLTSPKVVAAAAACLGTLTPAQRQQLLGASGAE